MAHIKCRYTRLYCEYDGERKAVSNECDWDGSCDGKYVPDQGQMTCKGLPVINPPCKYLVAIHREFEKDARQYEYDEGDLKVGRQWYCADEIEYLEIDGRVLKGGENGRHDQPAGGDSYSP